MLKEILNFGDTFRYAEKEYVYLAQVGDLVYALLILSEESTKNDNDMYEKKIANGNTTIGLVNKLIYAMVMLKTEEFKSRGAHLHYDAEHDVDDLSYDFIRCLEDEDKKKIIEAIKKEDVFPKLKDAFRDYNKSSF